MSAESAGASAGDGVTHLTTADLRLDNPESRDRFAFGASHKAQGDAVRPRDLASIGLSTGWLDVLSAAGHGCLRATRP
jgi:hypothetical protein